MLDADHAIGALDYEPRVPSHWGIFVDQNGDALPIPDGNDATQ